MMAAEVAQLDRMAADHLGNKVPAYMHGISASALMAKSFPPIRFVVQGYVAEGLTLLAGAPKIGKSWMALNVAVAVASGAAAFGGAPCEAGDVLYLALEDNHRRLQRRLRTMGVAEPPERLTFCTAWPSLAQGAVNEIEAWADSVEVPALVIVDVLAKVRDGAEGREKAYEADYRALSGLQALASTRNLAIVALHHTRKLDADDPFDSVSGTRGLTGAADTVLVLKRDNGTARTVLYGRGRDVEEVETAFEFDRNSGTWLALGAAAELGRTAERDDVLRVLMSAAKPMDAKEITDRLGKNYEATRRLLSRMFNDGEIEKEKRGLYTCLNGPNVSIEGEWDNETNGTRACEGDEACS